MSGLKGRVRRLENSHGGGVQVIFLNHDSIEEAAFFDINLAEAKARRIQVIIMCDCDPPYPSGTGVQVMSLVDGYLMMLNQTTVFPDWLHRSPPKPLPPGITSCGEMTPEQAYRYVFN